MNEYDLNECNMEVATNGVGIEVLFCGDIKYTTN
jgi:hypothetical protein